MTRARDELGPVARRGLRRRPGTAGLAVRPRSARPAGRRRDPAPGRTRTPEERLATFADGEPPVPEADRSEPLSLSFYQVDDYLTCPLKYKYAHVLRVPAGAAPRDRVWGGPAQGGPALPPPPRQGPRHDGGRARRAARGGLVERGLREPRTRGGRLAARGPRCAGSARPSWSRRRHPDLRRARVRVRARWRPGTRPLGSRRRRRDGGRDRPTPDRPRATDRAPTCSPTLGMLGPEQVTITDYKAPTCAIRPRRASGRASASSWTSTRWVRSDDRSPADAIGLYFLKSGLIGEVDVDPRRLARARDRIATAAAGMRARDYTPKPDYLACTYCAFRDICPSSVAR